MSQYPHSNPSLSPWANFCSPPSFLSLAARMLLNSSQRYLKCACWLHRVLSQRKQSVPSWLGMGLHTPWGEGEGRGGEGRSVPWLFGDAQHGGGSGQCHRD